LASRRRRTYQAHALAATAGDRLDQHRIADRLRLLDQGLLVLPFAMVAGDNRNAGLLHHPLGGIFGAHGPNGRRRRADEGQARGLQRLGELGVLGEEAVAGMHRLGARQPANIDDTFAAQVALGGRGGPEQKGLVSELHVAGLAVGLGIDRDACDAQSAGRRYDAAGDLSPVGD
jgi:hypothetical protein